MALASTYSTWHANSNTISTCASRQSQVTRYPKHNSAHTEHHAYVTIAIHLQWINTYLRRPVLTFDYSDIVSSIIRYYNSRLQLQRSASCSRYQHAQTWYGPYSSSTYRRSRRACTSSQNACACYQYLTNISGGVLPWLQMDLPRTTSTVLVLSACSYALTPFQKLLR